MDNNNTPKTEIDFKIQHPTEWLKSEMDMRAYLRNKRFVELLGLFIVLAAILLAGYWHLIEGETIAALLGTLVAYCFEHWRDKGNKI